MQYNYRSKDAVLFICQDNAAGRIMIDGANHFFQEATGLSADALQGQALSSLLPRRIAELLAEYVEYDDGANDVGAVLAKVQSFSVITQKGEELGFRLKVLRTESTPSHLHFQLILQQSQRQKKDYAIKQALADNFKGHEVLDALTGLPDRYSLAKDIELAGFYKQKSDLQAAFALLAIDGYQVLKAEQGEQVAGMLTRHIAQLCRQNMRPEDTVGAVSPERIGLLLLDAPPESIKIVMNRLRWQVAAHPFMLAGKAIDVSVSIVSLPIGGLIADADILPICEARLDSMPKDSRNILIEVTAA